MYCAYRFREQRRGMWYLMFAGSAIGGAVITRYQDALLGLLALGLYLILPGGMDRAVRDRVARLIMVGIGIVPFAGFIMWYNWFRFGSVTASGHYETVFGYTIWKGALGLLVSPGKGLLWYCPVIFLLALAGPRFARRFPALTIAFGAMTAGFFCCMATSPTGMATPRGASLHVCDAAVSDLAAGRTLPGFDT
jgi:hypothetical protein